MGNYQTVIKSVASLTSGDQTSRLFDNSFSPNGQNIFVGLANGVLHYWIEIYLKTIYEVKKVRMLYEYVYSFPCVISVCPYVISTCIYGQGPFKTCLLCGKRYIRITNPRLDVARIKDQKNAVAEKYCRPICSLSKLSLKRVF